MNAALSLPALEDIRAHEAEMVAIRHQIHANPELAYEEHATSDLVAERLTRWGYGVHRGLAGTGVVGTLRVGSSARRIGLRADMDALPIAEAESLSIMPAHHPKTRPLVVANARHSPSYGCALRLDRTRFGALLGHAQKTLSL